MIKNYARMVKTFLIDYKFRDIWYTNFLKSTRKTASPNMKFRISPEFSYEQPKNDFLKGKFKPFFEPPKQNILWEF